MSFVSEKLLRNIPPEWDPHPYTDKRYAKIKLDVKSTEYKNLQAYFTTKFNKTNVVGIERIQHPLAYSRFIQQKELLAANNEKVIEKRFCLRVTNVTKLEDILKFNCNPKKGGFNTFATSAPKSGYIIVLKMLGKEFDGILNNHYPEYLIQCQMTSVQSRLKAKKPYLQSNTNIGTALKKGNTKHLLKHFEGY